MLLVVFILNVTVIAADLYVRVRTSDCSKTKLSIKVEGLDKLPASVVFSIKDAKTSEMVVGSTNLSLQDAEYIWNGLIPFKDYTATVTFPGSKTLQDKFTNKNLLLQFLDQTSRAVQIRNGDKKKASDEVVKPSNLLENIPIGAIPSNIGVIHLLLINSDNKLADQYLGPPISRWNSAAPNGDYKLVIVEYDKDEPKCGVKSR